MPGNQALQVLYGTVPLIVTVLGISFRRRSLLKGILAGLIRIEEL
jgi:hypothetical protein